MDQHFGTLEAAWHASARELKQAGLDQRSVNNIVSQRAKVDPDAEMARLERHHVKALTWYYPQYPPRLKEIYNLPPVLYMLGSLEAQDEWAITFIGTRRLTAYSREMTETLAGTMARNKIAVVSGLARGILSLAHRSALKAGGRIITLQEIMESGALVSDYPLGTLSPSLTISFGGTVS